MANTLEYNTSRSDANFTLCGKPGAISFYRNHLVYHVDNAGNTNFSITLSKSTLKSRWICINASDDNLSLFIVDRTYVFNRRHMIMELESCLIKSENRFYAEYLLLRVIGNIMNEQIIAMDMH
jgi:hypothetical protein